MSAYTEKKIRPPYSDTCFFLSVVFSLLPFGIVPLTYFYGSEFFYRSEVYFLYAFAIVLFLTGSLLREREQFRERNKQQEKLERLLGEMRKFKLAVEYASDHIVITDAEGIILYANQAVQATTGYSPKEVIGKKAGGKAVWGGNMDSSFYKRLWETIQEDKKVFRGELQNTRKDGSSYIANASIAPVMNQQKEVEFFVGIERDVTKEREVDRAKTEFVSLVAHQLRSPLTAVRWYIEMLLAGDFGKIGSTKRSFERNTERQSKNDRSRGYIFEYFAHRVRDFFRVSKKMHPGDCIRDILLEVEKDREEKGIHIDKEISPLHTEYLIDELLFRIIAQNLISNAIKYNREGGNIRIQFFPYKKEGFVFSVSDTGMGIPMQQLGRVFSKMFRAENAVKSDVEGNGLGLYIVKEVVERSGGHITFETHENKGSCFCARYPNGMQKKTGKKNFLFSDCLGSCVEWKFQIKTE